MAANPLDTTALEETIAEAETLLAQVTDESDGGLYADGTHEALETAITAAEAVMKDLAGKDQVGVNQAKVALENAIYVAKTSRDIQYITFDELNADDWANVTSKELSMSVVGDELQIAEGITGQAMYAPGLGIRDILCFQYKVDENNSWHGFPIAQTNENAYAITSSTTGYFICISGNKVELQKRGVDGANGVQIYKEFDSAIVNGGEYYDIEIGAINYPDGSVGFHFKINDELIFDENVVRDTAEDKVIEGFGASIVGAPISEAPTFGVLAHKNNKMEYLKLSAADYTALEAEIAQADSMTQADYTTESWNAYQALLDKAEELATNLAEKEQATIDALVAELKEARQALVTATNPTPTPTPSAEPTATPSAEPTATPSAEPTATPSAEPTATPSAEPTATPTTAPVGTPEIIVEGTVTSYTKSSNTAVSIHCTGELNKLAVVKMDSQKVDEANYTVKEGSTIVTFKAEYLNSLAEGEHTVTLAYADGSSVESKLTILEKPANEDANQGADDTQNDDTSGDDNSSVAEDATDSTAANVTEASGSSTGDDSNLTLWLVLLACAALMCGFIVLKAKKVKK